MRPRKALRTALALLAFVPLPASWCAAQDAYPSRTVRLVIGFGAGGATDIVGRVLGNKLSAALGKSFVVENRTGGSGTVATEAVGRAEPDGYTLLMTPLANAVNETLFKGLKARGGEQLVAVASVAQTNNVLIVHPSLPVRSLSEFIAYAKGKPEGLVAASSGVGTAPHLAIGLFNTMTGANLTPVQYKGGGDSVRDLVTGEVKLMFATIAPILEYIRNGSLRAIATTGVQRDVALPDLPTMSEAGLPGFDVRLWLGIMAPRGTPEPVLATLSGEIEKALQDRDVKGAFAAQGFDPMPGGPDAFDAFYRSEVAKWRRVIETTGIKIE